MAASASRREVCERIVRDVRSRGYTVADLAIGLGVSEATVKRLRARVRDAEAEAARIRDARERALELVER